MSFISDFRSWLHKLFDGAYYVGVVDSIDLSELIGKGGNNLKYIDLKINWINLGRYRGGWFADPFILDANDSEITLLVEEYRYSNCKGRLSKIVVNRKDLELLSVEPILEHQTHLSFPYIVVTGKERYICPESYQRGETSLYDLDKGLELKSRIVSGRFVDTQIVEHDGSYYAFAVNLIGGGMDDTKRLKVYKAPKLDGPYIEFCSIDSEGCDRRGAGPIFKCGNKVIRPAQNCNGGYGLGVIFYQLHFHDDHVSETEIFRIDTNPKMKYGLCFHTFSPYDNLVAVDGFDYSCRLLGNVTPFMYKVKRLINKYIR